MKVELESFFLPKAGNSLAEYEDAFYPTAVPTGEADSVRLAVADGATETSFSAAWASLLVRAYCRKNLEPDNLESGLKKQQAVWTRHVRKKPMPWYAEQKIADGAFAAIVGLELRKDRRQWSAWAVGDCCVFHTRGESILARFPLEHSDQFDNRPALLSSVASNNNGVLDSVRQVEGGWESGDVFYLMSDALAAWFLRYSALKETNVIEYLDTLRTQSDFADSVSVQRGDKLTDGQPMMRNDDVTMLVCSVS